MPRNPSLWLPVVVLRLIRWMKLHPQHQVIQIVQIEYGSALLKQTTDLAYYRSLRSLFRATKSTKDKFQTSVAMQANWSVQVEGRGLCFLKRSKYLGIALWYA